MNEYYPDLKKLLQTQLTNESYDIINITPISKDTIERLSSPPIYEGLSSELHAHLHSDFSESSPENSDEETLGYFLQIKTKPKSKLSTSTPLERSIHVSPPHSESEFQVELPDGSLNIPFLLKNSSLLIENGEFNLARDILGAILRSGKATSSALLKIGYCHEAEGNSIEAVKAYEEAIAYNQSLECYQALATLWIGQGKDSQAAEILERASSIKDLDRTTQYELRKAAGNCWTRSNRIQQAEENFKKALEIDPAADEIRSNLGALFLRSNRIDEARRHFRDALASNSRNHLALAGLGSCFLAENNKKSAHDYFAQSLAIELNNPAAIYQLVKCAYGIKIYSTAAQFLEEYISTAPVNADLLYTFAGLQYHLGRITEAKATVDQLIQFEPHHDGAKELLSMISKFATGDN